MKNYISFLESLVDHLTSGSIESRWQFMIAEKDRIAAADAIKEYMRKYGVFYYNPEKKVWDSIIKDIVILPAEARYVFPFVTKGPLTRYENLVLLYDFFFKPKHTEVINTWSYS